MTGAMLPYLGSLLWYRRYMRALLTGRSVPGAERKAEHRCVIRSNTGSRLLTVPVVHGNAGMVSEHGGWRQAHAQALMSEYGRCPYYPHLMPQIEAVVMSGETDLLTINTRLHEVVMETVAPADTLEHVARLMRSDAALWHELHKERSTGEVETLSVIDVLMRRGPEAIFTLVDTL